MEKAIGLSSTEAREALKKYGKNIFIEREKQSALRAFLDEFKSPLILMLIFATLISFASGSTVSAILIISIIIISVVIDFSVSYKSQRAAQALSDSITPLVRVIRDSKEKSIGIEEIVPGDIVLLSSGNIIPADGIIVEGRDFYVNESSLTGESLPISKPIGSPVYLGSGVVSGHVKVRVEKTGYETKFADIASLLQKKEIPGEFERGIKQFSILITKVVIGMTGFVFLINALSKGDIIQSLIFSLALAVGLTPELLPMIIALNVSRASLKMSKKGVIVKKLSVIENFGSMNILCTDKTGTLTEDKITVIKCVDIEGADNDELCKIAYIDSMFQTGTKGPLDQAILAFKEFDYTGYKKIDEIPFDFERRMDSIVYKFEDRKFFVSKGAPEAVLPKCNLDNESHRKALELFENLSRDGYRVIALGIKEVTDHNGTYTRTDEIAMRFVGFITFIDPPKQDVKEILDELEKRNIEVKIVSGDHKIIVEHIARQVGLPSKGTITTEELDKLTEEEFCIAVEKNTLFVRIYPAQKNKIVEALKKNGNVVGYMGDGINDAPALRTADVGISVGNAVDVAKESADIILTTKSFGQLIEGVIEGRRTFANTVKYLTMAVSSNFGNMFSMTAASLFLPFLPMLPTQLLLNNLLYESSQSALTFDRVDDTLLDRPNPWNMHFIKKFMLVFGSISSIFDFMTFYLLFAVFNLSDGSFQTGWFIESFATQTLVIFLIRSAKPIWKASKPHIVVVLASSISVILAWSIALTQAGKVFGFVPLPPHIIVFILGIVIIYLVTVEIAKNIFYKKYHPPVNARMVPVRIVNS